MPIKIERVRLSNLDALSRIERESFTSEAYTREQIASLLESPNAVSLAAKVNDEIVGFIVGLTETGEDVTFGHVVTLDVAVKHRRAGVGLQLLDQLEQVFRRKGVKTIYLEVRIDNEAARELYRKKGYTDLVSLEDYYAK